MPEERNMNKHRGLLLKKAVKESDMTITKLMKRMGYKNRSSFYQHVDDPDLSYDILMKYGKLINHDFTVYFPSSNGQTQANDPLATYIKAPRNIEQVIVNVELLKDKYHDLVEKHNQLLEKLVLILERLDQLEKKI